MMFRTYIYNTCVTYRRRSVGGGISVGGLYDEYTKRKHLLVHKTGKQYIRVYSGVKNNRKPSSIKVGKKCLLEASAVRCYCSPCEPLM
jgi:hypothetical protein